MDDDEFLDYCYWHSRTERALFAAAHCRRLFALAAVPFPAPSLPDTAFRAMASDLVDPLVTQARSRLRST